MRRKTSFGLRSKRVVGPLVALFLVIAMVAGMPGAAGAQGWGHIKYSDEFMKKIGDNMKKQSDLRFQDLEEALWAATSIAKMRGLGVINGYDGNIFRPNSSAKQAEALAMMVRAFDMEDEAKALSDRLGISYGALDKKGHGFVISEDEDEQGGEVAAFSISGQLMPIVPADARWALGYILLAVDQGWVKLSECYPEKPATRAWVSTVMVRALDHEAQALSKMNTVLTFKDAAAIPTDSVGYVAEAVAMGLFKGYDDNTFQPSKPVSRAEMATILDRFLGQELPADMPYLASGTIQTVSSSGITLKTRTGQALTYAVSADALILIDRKTASRADLRIGDQVEILSNGTGVALLITVTSRTAVPPASEVTGDITGISMPPALTLRVDAHTTRTIAVASNCTIKMGTATLVYADLLLGDRVKATLQDNVALSIVVLSRGQTTQTVTGVIYGITMSTTATDIQVNQTSSQITLRLAESVQITYGTTTLTPAGLRTGDQVEATLQNGQVTLLRVIARDVATLFGDVGGTTVSITQTTTETVIVLDNQGTRYTVKVTPQTLITFGTATVSRGDLRLGDVMRVKLTGDTATEIRVSTRGLG